MSRSKNRKSGKIIYLIVVIIALCGIYYIYTSKKFERIRPNIGANNIIYWQPNNDLNVKISDNSHIKKYTITIILPNGKKETIKKILTTPMQNITVNLKNLGIGNSLASGQINMVIEAYDDSNWNFFNGNVATKKVKLIIDKTEPIVNVLSNSPSIKKGGSAIVIFKVKDTNLKDVYVRVYNKVFKPQTFIKKGYYVTLMAWPLKDDSFRAVIVAIDKANNIVKKLINIKVINRRYPSSTIKLTNKFLKNKIKEIAESSRSENENINNHYSDLQNFILVNEKLRNIDETTIMKTTTSVDQKKVITDFNINRFKPLPRGLIVAAFGGHRTFTKNKKIVSASIHRGLDMATIPHDNVIASNNGVVVLTKKFYDYGNTAILSHGLGLYTSYSHMSKFNVEKNDTISTNSTIGITGQTGLALGDHLHFGVYVQGVFVNPNEWINKSWIKYNLIYEIDQAKKMIKSDI